MNERGLEHGACGHSLSVLRKGAPHRLRRGRLGTNFGEEVLEQMFCRPKILVGGFV